jgi:uncharacterized glyoxalase superfamily protein PhnB
MSQFLSSTPLLHVADAVAAEAFYCDKLGFTKAWSYCAGAEPNPCYMGLQRDGVWLHVSSFSGDGVSRNVAIFNVTDIDKLFSEFKSRDVVIELEPYDQTWGNREMYLRDLDGNSLRFIQAK